MHNVSEGSAYLISEPVLLGAVMSEARKYDYQGSLRAGVDQTNRQVEKVEKAHRRGASAGWLPGLPTATPVDYSTAWRLLNRKGTRMKGSTFSWLTLFVGRDRCERLERAVVSPLAQGLIAEQEGWERKEFIRHVQDPSPVLNAALGLPSRNARLLDLLLEMLKANPGKCQWFVKQTTGHSEHRTRLALLRLVAPFLDGSPHGLERTWEEMDKTDRKKYVRLTLEREELLLQRLPDRQRAWEVSARIHKRPPPSGLPT